VTLDRLTNSLKRDGIETVLRKNDAGIIYGITYVDHRSKSVFNGSTLGKNYSAKAIQERCVSVVQQPANVISNNVKQSQSGKNIGARASATSYAQQAYSQFSENKISDGADALFDPVKQDGYTPSALRAGKRRKKKGISQSL
jgi:hypothetical protein